MKALGIFLALSIFAASASAGELRIDLGNVSSKQGDLFVALFEPEAGFPSNSAGALRNIISPIDNAGPFIIDDLPAGDYAIALFHDRNRDGTLNTNFMGIPKEPFGFSNNPRIMFGAPNFRESKFSIKEDEIKTIRIDLKTIF